MIRLLGDINSLPKPLYVAVSGGADSMAVADFLLNARHTIIVAHRNHGTEHGKEADRFVNEYFAKRGVEVCTDRLEAIKDPKKSWEEHWRDTRKNFFRSLKGTVIACHHLNDVVETWLFSAMNGNAFTIPYCNKNVYRPFLLTPRADLKQWCEDHRVPWIEDPSNADVKYARNRIRHRIIPEVLQINPGIEKVVARKIREAYDEYLKCQQWEDTGEVVEEFPVEGAETVILTRR